jgi:hypothetical protein
VESEPTEIFLAPIHCSQGNIEILQIEKIGEDEFKFFLEGLDFMFE